jgi:DNA-cytosine methyltransferase
MEGSEPYMIIEKIIKDIAANSSHYEGSLDISYRKRTGSYYTSLELTIPMVRELFDNIGIDKADIHDLKFLEPCVGTGNFVFAYILVASEYLKKGLLKKLLNNIYVCDINENALEEYKKQLISISQKYFDIQLSEEYFDTHMGRGLLFDVTQVNPEYMSVNTVFGDGSERSFDIVMTNPPYKNLKAEVGHYESGDEKNSDKKKYDRISTLAKSVLPLSTTGTLNIYKLFTEEILEKYASDGALVSLLVPTSILTDKTCEKLRKKIITDYHIISIKNIPENNKFIKAQQALTAILIDKKGSTVSNPLTNICKSYRSEGDELAIVNVKKLANRDNGYTVLALNQNELDQIEKMSAHPKLRDLPFLKNLRGELDLTINKGSILDINTPYKLVRGRNIGYYKEVATNIQNYVSPEFVNETSKHAYINMERLACQQISNIAKERRLTFTKVQPMSVLANSCNFIAVGQNDYKIDANYIIGLLNSKLMNWFFKLHSSNNHINNYEINNFPIPIHGDSIKQISELVKSVDAADTPTIDKIDELVCVLFGINEKVNSQVVQADIANGTTYYENIALQDLRYIMPQIQSTDVHDLMAGLQSIESTILKYAPSISTLNRKVVQGLVDKYTKLSEGIILNHTTFKLSDLDMEMIRPIPQGGNWKNIPKKTVDKSRRLIKITETGGRTTLYGRLHYNKPSYTITTYFNRPGNGTYVHPIHDRVLSVREAARFQAFPDDHYIYGNKTQTLKQIGNAVPALMAYQIGRKIVDRIGVVKSVDLFCGAGGLTSGFKDAGIQTILCTDYDEAACATIKINNPESEVICGDITDSTIKKQIIRSAIKNGVDIVCGGPPCQGFSMAGYRDENDPRNQLFKEFVEVVRETNPKIVLFENVEGILTYKGGETYKAIHQLFNEIGYWTEGRLLKTDRYGVPQKRKRVIIICTRKDTNIDPASIYPDEVTSDDTNKVTAGDTIKDLENVECSEYARFDDQTSKISSSYNKMLDKSISPEEFLRILGENVQSEPPRQLQLISVQ